MFGEEGRYSGTGRGPAALAAEQFLRIGTEVIDPSTALANGLTEAATNDLGLVADTRVGASLDRRVMTPLSCGADPMSATERLRMPRTDISCSLLQRGCWPTPTLGIRTAGDQPV